MNCREFEQWTGPYLSGEVEGPLRADLDHHGNTCESCAQLLERCTEIDERVRHAVLRDEADAAGVVSRARSAIARRSLQSRWLGIAAGLVLAVGTFWGFQNYHPAVPDELIAAARDHRAEVVRGNRRRWLETTDDVQKLLSEYRLDPKQMATLAPVGFVLQKAKQCGIDGSPALHMVFSDGKQAFSVFVHAAGVPITSGAGEMDGVAVAAFQRGPISGIVAAPDHRLCEDAARHLSAL